MWHALEFPTKKNAALSVKQLGKQIRENNGRKKILYNIFINKNHVHINQFSTVLGINKLPHPTKSNSYHQIIFIIVQLMKKRVLHEAHNTKNSNKLKK